MKYYLVRFTSGADAVDRVSNPCGRSLHVHSWYRVPFFGEPPMANLATWPLSITIPGLVSCPLGVVACYYSINRPKLRVR